jgi:HEAT repeat protein
MNLLDTVISISVVLTILSLLLLLIIVGVHLFADRHARREADFRKTAEPAVESYFADPARLEAAVAELKKDPKNALKLLVERSEALGPEERERLHPLFAAFPFVQQELAGLKSRRWDARLRSAEFLGYQGDKCAIPGLLEALKDETLAVRLAAAESLASLGGSDTVKPILIALDAPGEMPQRQVAEVLFEFGPRAAAPILTILNDPETTDSQLIIAVRVSGMLHEVRAVPRLVELLKHQVMEVRLNSVRALASIGDRSAILPIARLGEDPAWEVRNSVMHALGHMRAVDHVPLLVQGLADIAWWVRYSAAEALYQLGDDGMKALKNAAELHVDRYARDISRQILQEHGIHHTAGEVLP